MLDRISHLPAALKYRLLGCGGFSVCDLVRRVALTYSERACFRAQVEYRVDLIEFVRWPAWARAGRYPIHGKAPNVGLSTGEVSEAGPKLSREEICLVTGRAKDGISCLGTQTGLVGTATHAMLEMG